MADMDLQSTGKKQVEPKAELTYARPVFTPAVDIYETKDALVVLADMPGVDQSGVDIHLEEGTLTIRGKVAAEEEAKTSLYSEYRTGDYYRTFTLSNMIDQERIEATIKDGVLKLTLPKAEIAKPRQIAVKAG